LVPSSGHGPTHSEGWTGGITGGNSPVARPGHSPKPCKPGTIKILGPAGQETCPCSGVVVACFRCLVCKDFWVPSTSLGFENQGILVEQRVCHRCPEY
jgi:hypothetical protein